MNSIIAPDSAKKRKNIALQGMVDAVATFQLDFEWGVVAFASGIALYFALSFEPRSGLIAIALLVTTLAYWRPGNSPRGLKPALLLLVLILLGLGRSTWHTQAVKSPVLPGYERAYLVTGWVKSIGASGSRTRWEIAVQDIEGMDPDVMPAIIRTTSAGEGVEAGDFIRIRSVLSAPPGPAVPGGYDPGRRAYFDKIGGYGFAISKPEKIEIPAKLDIRQRLQRKVVQLRYRIAGRVMEAAPPETAGLQASLLTGIRTYIPEEQTDALRIAGLAHILAISGLHMGLVAFGIYSLSSLLFACVLPLSRRYDVRKGAAVFGAAAATFYLVLSGASVATQRAYIMVMIVFLAACLDRRAFSMRSVALAALITLLWHPEALLSAGFQMSFSAVAALVVVYRYWDARRTYRPGYRAKAWNAMASLTVTSFVAGFATAAIAVLHFNRMASYGLAGNLVAMPVFTFWVMPAAIAVFPALLIGQEYIPLWIMGEGLDVVLRVSNWVAGWDGALAYIKAPPSWVLSLYCISFAALCLGPRILRISGLAGVILCMFVWIGTPTPDLRISQKGVVAFWGEGDRDILYVERKRTDRYGREQFTRRAGTGEPETQSYKKGLAHCNALACRIDLKGLRVSITAYPSEIMEECNHTDLVILTKREAGPVARRRCNARLIGPSTLARSGALDVYLGGGEIRLEPAKRPGRAKRPWG